MAPCCSGMLLISQRLEEPCCADKLPRLDRLAPHDRRARMRLQRTEGAGGSGAGEDATRSVPAQNAGVGRTERRGARVSEQIWNGGTRSGSRRKTLNVPHITSTHGATLRNVSHAGRGGVQNHLRLSPAPQARARASTRHLCAAEADGAEGERERTCSSLQEAPHHSRSWSWTQQMQPCHPSTPSHPRPPPRLPPSLPPNQEACFKNPHSETRAGIDSPPTSSFPRCSI